MGTTFLSDFSVDRAQEIGPGGFVSDVTIKDERSSGGPFRVLLDFPAALVANGATTTFGLQLDFNNGGMVQKWTCGFAYQANPSRY